MKQIILYKKGSISRADSKALKDEGYLPISCSNINDISMMLPDCRRLSGDMVLKAAFNALGGPSSASERQKFGEEIMKKIMDGSRKL